MGFDVADLLRRTAEAVDIPADTVLDIPRVTITGAERVFVENHKGLLGYSEGEMLINGGPVIIKLTGQNFGLRGMTERELEVRGRLRSLELISWESMVR